MSPALAPATVDTRHVGAPGCLLARFPVQTKAGQGAGFGQGAVVCRPLAWRALGTSLLQGSGRSRKEGWSMRGPLLLQPARREPPWSATCVLNALLAKAACRSDDAQDVRVPLGPRLIELEMRSSACPLLSNYCHRHPPLSLELVETVTVSVSPLGDGLSGH